MQQRFEIFPKACDLTELIHQAIALAQPQIQQNELQLETDLQPCRTPLNLDSTRILQVLANLLTNAIKFTPRGGRITLRLIDEPTQVQIRVSDTGIGIAPNQLPYVFERFRQADSSNTRRTGGLGLGLFLVQSIVEAHGGTVVAESPGKDQGATFTITLPKALVEAAVPPPSAPVMGTDLHDIRILLIEDDELTSRAISFVLAQHGAIVTIAESAVEALERLTQDLPNLLISDIGLPDVNGYDLIRQIRALPPQHGGELPAIALSGYADQRSVNTALEAGFQIYLSKPVNPDHLVACISNLAQH